jgi:putative Ca2+/H+ antiporter (TMEM165/GDT1 family)
MLAEMTFAERHTWIFGVTTLLSYVAYLAVILGRAQGTPLAEVAHFWIANAVYLCFALSALLGSATKIIAYRRGFQSC